MNHCDERTDYDAHRQSAVDRLADALADARRQRRAPSVADWRDAIQGRADAYRVQDGVAERLGWFQHEPPRAWKTGAPATGAEPTHAPLPTSGLLPSGTAWPRPDSFAIGIEAEVAFRLGSSITPAMMATLDRAAVPDLLDAMLVTIELVSPRWREGTASPPLLQLADQQSHGALVVGDPVPFARRRWPDQRCNVRIDGTTVASTSGSHPLGDPTLLLHAWLSHATRDGASVPAGTLVTTGAWTGLMPLAEWGRADVTFDGIGTVVVSR